MIQKKYLCRNLKSVEDELVKIKEILSSNPYRSAIVTFYETGLSKKEVEELVSKIKGYGFPNLQIAGISLTTVAELMHDGGTGVLLNLIVAEKSDIEVVTIPCEPGGEEKAAAVLNSRLNAHKNVAAVELFGSNMELKTTVFMEKAMEGHEDAVLFGTSTLRNLTKRVSMEEKENSFEVERVDETMPVRDELIVGDRIIEDGFVGIIFSGENLKVQSHYALGWKPIGKKLSIKLDKNVTKGESLITEISSMPAVDIFREYLGVYPDSFLISNICEFPLVVEREGINICMVPIEGGKNGELYYMLALKPEDELRFSFASHDEVLQASRESVKKMEAFRPEVLFLTLCGNRINFLKEDAYLEWDEFDNIAPDYALMHGAGELYYYQGKGGVLNSAHLAIGLRESDIPIDAAVYEHQSLESLRKGHVLSLSDRMSTFLDKITSELVDAADQARAANKAKSAFLSHMSHEIRTPINAILAMDEMILKESKDTGILNYADDIRSAGDNLLGIINDVLDFSKIEAGRMRLVPSEYELLTVIKDMHNIIRYRAKDKGLSFKLDIDPSLPSVLFGDSLRIKQVITNILTNAVKYTENGSVTFSMKKVSDGTADEMEGFKKMYPSDIDIKNTVKIRVSVKDTGIGIKTEDLQKLFDEYERFDERRNSTIEGTGLGLSITRELLELMDCKLKVESKYGEGSEFSFEILQGVVNSEAFGDVEGQLNKIETKTKRIRFTAADARILVVDDTPINLRIISRLLKNTKIHIDTAESGEQALQLVTERAYDVIFLDHRMPEMDGPETLKRMNEMENNLSAGAPVISLTANALTNARDEYIRAGYKDYLSKPVRPEELEDMLFYYIPSEKIRTVPIDA